MLLRYAYEVQTTTLRIAKDILLQSYFSQIYPNIQNTFYSKTKAFFDLCFYSLPHLENLSLSPWLMQYPTFNTHLVLF